MIMRTLIKALPTSYNIINHVVHIIHHLLSHERLNALAH